MKTIFSSMTNPLLITAHRCNVTAHQTFDASSSGVASSITSNICSNKKLPDLMSPQRQSGNHQLLRWDFDHVMSLKNHYAEEKHINRREVLKEQVKMMLDQGVEVINQLELIDDIQRLGLSYHFVDECSSLLSGIYNRRSMNKMPNQWGLYATSLEFRLLRQHGFDVSQVASNGPLHYISNDVEIFDCFKDEKGDFRTSLCEDSKGMLQLLEASYLESEHEESNLEMAREFAVKTLKKNLNDNRVDQDLVALVEHSLELPLHWRMMRLEASWFIDIYEQRSNRNPVLFELAKLDFNIVQATHQNDLKYALRWWSNTCLAEKLTFGRDMMVENFFWTVGMISEPQHGNGRRILTKVVALITAIDDVYDGYGTLDELTAFTTAVERWDVNSIDQLPADCMKMCFLALYNFVNEMAYDALKEHGVNIIPCLRKSWADLCKAYLQEAQWFSNGDVPTLQEYLNNAWISISVPVVLIHAYFCVDYNHIDKENLERLMNDYHKIIRCTAVILRLSNDLGTSPESEVLKSGDVAKAIECYRKETGASEKKAREYIRFVMIEAWKGLNDLAQVSNSSTSFSSTFMNGVALNLARTGLCMYQHGDGHGYLNSEPKNRILALLFEPVSCLAWA